MLTQDMLTARNKQTSLPQIKPLWLLMQVCFQLLEMIDAIKQSLTEPNNTRHRFISADVAGVPVT